MTIKFCPNCNRRIITDKFNTDFIHDCSQEPDVSEAIKQEDIVVIGNWEDFSGSGTKAPQEVMRQGAINEFLGKRAGIYGEDKEEETKRGARASTHRQRAHLEYIKFTKDKTGIV